MVASLRGDAYGFGAVLLELVTGQKPLEVSNVEDGLKGKLVDWVNELSSSGRIKDAISKELCGKVYDEEILNFLKIKYIYIYIFKGRDFMRGSMRSCHVVL